MPFVVTAAMFGLVDIPRVQLSSLRVLSSLQSFDESGRRTTAPSVMAGTIGFRVFSCWDDGMGQASVERILDTWQEEGIENSQEILKVWPLL